MQLLESPQDSYSLDDFARRNRPPIMVTAMPTNLADVANTQVPHDKPMPLARATARQSH